MRSAWKYNDLKPRVYYAQGPTCYKSSKYVQPIFNAIMDAFEVCHRILRFSSPTTSLEDSILYVYDYSSFTSSLTESTRFIYALADFYQDVEVQVLDTHEGFQYLSVGDILRSYARDCALYPEFDVSRLLPQEGTVGIRLHNCGMLGVPGNLASCTILHAIHLMYISGSMSSVRCVGDDGLAIVPGEDVESVIDAVNNLGEVAREKTEWWGPVEVPLRDWRQEAWHYVKRPIYRVHDTYVQGSLFIFPSLEYILNLSDQYHRSATMGLSITERKRRAIRQLMRLWSDLASHSSVLTDTSISLLDEFARMFFITLELPFRGGAISTSHGAWGTSLLVPPKPEGEMWSEDPYQLQLEVLRGSSIVVPAWRGFDEEIPDVGQEFVSRSSRLVSTLVSLGVLQKTGIVREEVHLDFGADERNLMYLRMDYSFSYMYTVLETPPSWAHLRYGH